MAVFIGSVVFYWLSVVLIVATIHGGRIGGK